MFDKLGFTNYTRNGWYYGGRITKNNFHDVCRFIDNCTISAPLIDITNHTITFTSRSLGDNREQKVAKIGDYLMRNVTGGDYAEMFVLKRYEIKQRFSVKHNYAQLTFYQLTDVEYNVLRCILAQNTEWFYPYSSLEEYTGVDRKETKIATKHLRELGLLEFQNGLMTDEGEVAGSGFGISSPIQELLAELLMRRKQDSIHDSFDPDMELKNA